MLRRLPPATLVLALVLALVPAIASAQPTEDGAAPAWAHEASIYHVFTDRFRNGDPSNPDVDPDLDFSEALRNWMGGDLTGVMQGLDHIESLGFDTVWLGPVYENAYFHGYHPIDFLEVDDNFGTVEQMAALVDEVHARGMRIIYDFVPNHTSNQHPFFQDAQERCQASPYVAFYRFNEDCTEYEQYFGLPELPVLDLRSADTPAAEYLLEEVVPFYLDELDFDGFRIDHAEGPSVEFFAAVRDVAKAIDPDTFLLGELLTSRERIAEYEGVLDGSLNTALMDAFKTAIAQDRDMSRIDREVRADLEAYGEGFVLTSFLDSHDSQRFVYAAGNDADAREKLKQAFVTQFSLPHAPVVYYGTEVGMGQTANTAIPGEGWVDRWYREPMPWQDDHTWPHEGTDGWVEQEWHADVAAVVEEMNALRDARPVLVHGEYRPAGPTTETLAFERFDDDERLLVVVHRGAAGPLSLADLLDAPIPDGVTLTALRAGGTTASTDGDLTLPLTDFHAEVYEVTGDLPVAPPPPPPEDVPPEQVVIAGNLQDELGCEADWDPSCTATALEQDPVSGVWEATFTLPAGTYEYKAALDGTWERNYGLNATPDGPNIPLSLQEETEVTFLFSFATRWVTDDVRSRIVTAPGDYQSEVGCPGDWDPACMVTWLQDPDGDDVYEWTTTAIPAGSWEAKAAIDRSWDENYGAGGVRGGPNIPFTVARDGDPLTFRFVSETNVLTIEGAGEEPAPDLTARRAHWVTADVIAWPWPVEEGATYRLHHSATAGLAIGDGDVAGADGSVALTPGGDLPPVVAERFRHLSEHTPLRVTGLDRDAVAALLRGQLAVSATADGELLQATGVQIPGVLDDVYADAADDVELGVSWAGEVPTVRLWAPTAQTVTLHRFTASQPPGDDPLAGAVASTPMTRDDATGVWSLQGQPGWDRQYYLFEVEVYQPTTRSIERNVVTDPYSHSLSMDSTRSQIVDLTDPDLAPGDWEELDKPAFDGYPTIYELHLRDFSANDATVPEEHVGTYLAFTDPETAGMRHLADLAEAGLTHLHLLPTNDIATIPEDPADQVNPTIPRPEDPAAEEPQAIQQATRDQQPFNWGYDPFHFTTPEGSYATDPDGPARIAEFRAMVASVNEIGLRLVKDVVYNHTHAAGQHPKSVLDQVVPGYYQRLDERGNVATSTCCPNTASEHRMMGKLMVDSVVDWARHYKVDGFRFDLMGHHMKANMLEIRAALDALTLEEDGVDGSKVILYGEGWNFGEVENDRRFEQATQWNMAGTQIGTFNDRLRDGVRGGSPFSGIREQGWATGLATDPNDADQGTPEAQLERAHQQQLWVKLGLAGNLRDYVLETPDGEARRGDEILYGDAPAGYAEHPLDNVVYVSKHDNETLFDAIQLKAPADLPMEERVRMQTLALSTVAFSQGVPFFHAGSDLLRSKSLDRNSYNSGDYFNRIDWTRQESIFGVGLPPAADNQGSWPIQRDVLRTRPVPEPEHIEHTAEVFQELLRIRAAHDVFRMGSAEEIAERITFHADGEDARPGLIVMELDGGDEADLLVVFNARPEAVTVPADEVAAGDWTLHPVQQASHDARVRDAAFRDGAFAVPARTTAVFVSEEPATEDRVTRLAGRGRVETAIAISRDAFDDGAADAVVLARADIYPDALAGTPLAVRRGAPLLLTSSNRLLEQVAEEIGRVLPPGGTVWLLGGEAALAPGVQAALDGLGYRTRRVSGPTRVETSVAVARALDAPSPLLLTTGTNFPDALAAGAAAAHTGGAVLLVAGDRPHPAVTAYLGERPEAARYAVGGPGVRAYPQATAVSGPTREETAVAVATRFFEDPEVVGIARRDTFPDALAGGAHIGARGGPLLVTPTTSLHPAVRGYLCAGAEEISTAYVYGGEAAISAATASAVGSAIGGTGCD